MNFLLLALTLAHADECANPVALLQSAEQDAVNFYLNEADTDLAKAVEAFGCSGKATNTDIARLWQTRGMVSMLREDDEAAVRAFAASKVADPDNWNEDFGDKAKAMWAGAAEMQGDSLGLTLRGVGKEDWVLVDGHDAGADLDLSPGLHLIQVGTGDAARFAKVIVVEGGEDQELTVPANESQSLPIAETTASIKKKSKVKVAPLITAGVAAAVAGGATFLAAQERQAFFDMSGSFDAAGSTSHYKRANTLSYVGIGAGVASAGLLVVSFTF